MNTASTSPLTARKAALGSAAIRCAAGSVAALRVSRAARRAARIVSQGPARTSPTMIRASSAPDSRASGSLPFRYTGPANNPSPASSGDHPPPPRRGRRGLPGRAER
ncbi:hypothetical protein ACFPKZ_07635 [Streptosporangium amethystogenes subsp. fukuiense]|uniref:hypothetical protein n=1 Tax=Streptosporangium amethystogenes TaxID=2002 RepID=UPI00361F8853